MVTFYNIYRMYYIKKKHFIKKLVLIQPRREIGLFDLVNYLLTLKDIRIFRNI